MRVTNLGLTTFVSDNLHSAYRRVAAAQEQVTTGRRINRLSDDPVGAVRVFGLRNFTASLDQYDKNINKIFPFIKQADSVLGQAEESLFRAKELALASANDSQSAADRANTAKEIHELRQQLLNIANTKVDNRYIFAGFANDAAPFTDGGASVAYNGDSGVLKIPTSSASTVELNVPGDVIFQGVGLTGGVDIFDVLSDLETALVNNDVNGVNGIQTQLTRIDNGIDQLLGVRAQFGSRINNAEGAQKALAVLQEQAESERTQIEDVDVLQAYTDFVRYQKMFEAALSSAAQVVQPSLLDFLR